MIFLPLKIAKYCYEYVTIEEFSDVVKFKIFLGEHVNNFFFAG